MADDAELEQQIHDILFSGEPIDQPEKYGFPVKKWLNHKCDVQMVWAHIFHERDVFVTSDRNFHAKAKELQKTG